MDTATATGPVLVPEDPMVTALVLALEVPAVTDHKARPRIFPTQIAPSCSEVHRPTRKRSIDRCVAE